MATKRTVKATNSDKFYVVEVGYYKDKTFADAKVLELKQKGINASISVRKNEESDI